MAKKKQRKDPPLIVEIIELKNQLTEEEYVKKLSLFLIHEDARQRAAKLQNKKRK